MKDIKQEKFLKESTDILENFFSQSTAGFFFMMLDKPIKWDETVDKEKTINYVLKHHKITRINKAMLDQYLAKEEDFIGLSVEDLFSHDIEYGKSVWIQFFNEGKLHIETKEKKFDGSDMDVVGDYICLYDENGFIKGHFGIQIDVTNEKRTLEKLKKSEKQLSRILDITGEGIWDWDIKNNIVTHNKRWCEILGLDNSKLSHSLNFFKECIFIDDRENVVNNIKNVLKEGNKYNSEHRMVKTDGEIIWVRDKGAVIEKDDFGKPIRMIGSILDITDNKKGEFQLLNERIRLANIIKGTNAGTWEWNIQTGETIFNERWAEIIGYSLEEISPVSIDTWIKFTHQEDLEKSKELLNKHFKKELEYYEVELRMKHKNGSLVWILDRGKVFSWTDDGKPLLMMGTHQDITKQKEIQIELEQAKEQAEAANKAKSEFLSNMSHEIRTPLNVVIGFTNLLKDTKLTDIQQEYVNSANTAGRALLGIISDILDLSKIEAGKLELQLEKTNIENILKDVFEIIKIKLDEKSIELIVENNLPYKKIYFLLDELKVKQILLNLLGNAIKFTDKGFIKVVLYLDGCKEENKSNLNIKIIDSGIGISKEEQQRIFESFTQQNGQSAKKYGGTGLGLTISKKLADMMNGDINIESKLNKGSVFTLILKDIDCFIDEKSKKKLLDYNTNSNIKLYKKKENDFNPEKSLTILDRIKIKEIFFERWSEINKLIVGTDVENFVRDLIKYSKENNLTDLQHYGEKLLYYTLEFELDNMEEFFKKLEKIFIDSKSIHI